MTSEEIIKMIQEFYDHDEENREVNVSNADLVRHEARQLARSEIIRAIKIREDDECVKEPDYIKQFFNLMDAKKRRIM